MTAGSNLVVTGLAPVGSNLVVAGGLTVGGAMWTQSLTVTSNLIAPGLAVGSNLVVPNLSVSCNATVVGGGLLATSNVTAFTCNSGVALVTPSVASLSTGLAAWYPFDGDLLDKSGCGGVGGATTALVATGDVRFVRARPGAGGNPIGGGVASSYLAPTAVAYSTSNVSVALAQAK